MCLDFVKITLQVVEMAGLGDRSFRANRNLQTHIKHVYSQKGINKKQLPMPNWYAVTS